MHARSGRRGRNGMHAYGFDGLGNALGKTHNTESWETDVG